tara:strand:+ start:531 stop:1031 length:501 start_codon:yes stop_codon:yes gene_type:complete
MKFYFFLIPIYLITQNAIYSQNDEEYEVLNPINDYSLEGQIQYISELLDSSGYVINSIIVYQTLPNNARVFQIDLDENNGGFVFIRWDKKKKENYVANKLIDPEIYYNLKSAQEIRRNQTEKKSFGIKDVAIQASDQEKITKNDLEMLREEYTKQQEEIELTKQGK